MANSNKGLLITPNIGSSSANPGILFSGADASTAAQNISATIYPTNNGTLSIDGSVGQLFSITNSLTGTIFSVNDVSGMPSIEVLDTGVIKLAQYSGSVGIGTASPVNKLDVTGSIGVTGQLISTIATGTAPFVITSTTAVSNLSIGGNAATATNLQGGNNTTLLGSLPYQSNTNVTTLLSPNTTATKLFLSQTGTGTNSAIPVWSVVSKSDVGLSLVENTALSTWAGTTNLVTMGNITPLSVVVGTLGFTPTNRLASFQSSVTTYNQVLVQNTNAGTGASSDIALHNNLGTDLTYYCNIGINSSAFTGSGSFNLPNASYITATSGDLAIGTTTANAIRFVVNSGAADAGGFSSSGVFSLATALAGSSGGTGNAFTTFTGPTAARSYALPDASSTLLYSGGALGTPSGGTLTNCTFPTLNQSTTGSANSLKAPATTGLVTIGGMTTGVTRAKTVRDADDTLLELGGSYSPSGTWTFASDITVNGLTVGKGAGAIATNTAVGHQALQVNTSGSNNVAIGNNSLSSNTTGIYNVSIGGNVLAANTIGGSNIALGLNTAGYNISGSNNIAIGLQALMYNTITSNQTAIGYSALMNCTTNVATLGTIIGGSAYTNGTYNGVQLTLASGSTAVTYPTVNITVSGGAVTAVVIVTPGVGFQDTTTVLTCPAASIGGTGSGWSVPVATLASGIGNVAVGYQALQANTIGTNNTAVGYQALIVNSTGINNTALGYAALTANTTGHRNTASGTQSLYYNTTGNQNVASGFQSLLYNTTGIYNNSIGVYSLRSNISGSSNTAIGYQALTNNTTVSNQTAIGYNALSNCTTTVATLGTITGGSGYANGTYNGVQLTLSSGSTAITYPTANITVSGGAVTAVTLVTSGVGFIDTTTVLTCPAASIGGTGSGWSVPVATLASGSCNVAVGYNALASTTTSGSNVAVGYNALANTTTAGGSNVAIGYQALYFNTTGFGNSVVGQGAMQTNMTGIYNSGLGYCSLFQNIAGSYNVAVGQGALFLNNASNNTAIGVNTLKYSTTSNNQTAIGCQALYNCTTNVATLGIIVPGSAYTNGSYTNVQLTLASGSTANTYPTANITVSGGAVIAVTLVTLGQGFIDTTTVLTCPAASIGGTGSGFSVPVATLASGISNTAIGYSALNANTTGSWNTSVGYNALAANTTGGNNIALGLSSLLNTTTGSYNTSIGNSALGDNLSGNNNTVIGYNTGRGITTGANNTILGANVGGLASGLTNNIILANGTGAGIKAQHDGTDWTLTGKVNVSSQIVSTLVTGTAPFVVASTTPVANLSIGGNAATVTTNANLTGEVTSVGNAATLTNSAVIAKVLTGYASGSGTVSASDSILSAIQKLDGNDAANLITAKAYADGLVVGLWDDRGSYNASTTNQYPAAGGSGTAGAILKGDIWTISVVSVSGPLLGYGIGTIIRALTDAPGQTVGNWSITGFSYTAANVANGLNQFAATTSLQLSGVISDETGSGLLVFNNTPTFITPILGTPTSGNLANCTFPTLNQSTTGGAATLTTARNIYGNSFNGSADIAQVIAATYGGTGNAYTQFTGPTTSIKTFTLPDASSTLLYSGGALGTPSSGTLTNCTFPTLNQSTTGSANSLKAPATTGLVTIGGMTAGVTRAKTVRDADDTLLELGGSYSPSGVWTFSSTLVSTTTYNVATGGGNIYLNSATGNRIDFNANGYAAPTFTTRSVGTKIVLYPAVDATHVDWAIGIDVSTTWFSVPQAITTQYFKWYAGTTNVMQLSGTGVLTLADGTAALPTITSVTGTADTGIWYPAAQTIAISTAGVERLRVDSVGILNTYQQIVSTSTYSAATGAGNIYLNSASGNRIDFLGVGVAPPAYTTRSAGTKIVLWPGITGGSVDYALGVDTNCLWFSTYSSTYYFKWYAGTTNVMQLSGTGVLTLADGTAALPTITSVTGTADTGIWFPAAKTIAISNAGVESFRIASTGAATFAKDLTVNGIKIGSGAGSINTNTAVGPIGVLNSNTSGSYNTAIGLSTLLSNTTGINNTAIGADALYYNISGANNTAAGFNSLIFNVTGSNNISIGSNALFYNTVTSNQIAIGYNALQNCTTNVATLGTITGGSAYTNGTYNGVQLTLASGSTANNYSTANITVSGGAVTAVVIVTPGVGFKDTTTVLTCPAASIGGTGSGWSVPVATLASGISNTAIGYSALNANTTGSWNTSVGYNALAANTTGGNNIALGLSSLLNTTTGSYNTSIGTNALLEHISGTGNIAIGGNTGRGITTGSGNTIIGYNVTGLASGLTNNVILASGAGIKAQHDGTDWTLTGKVNVSSQIVSTLVTGTAPFVVASTTPVANLSIGGNAATVTTNANLTGEVTSVGNAATLTNSAVIAKVLTGYASGSGTVSASDSILSAIQKVDGNVGLNFTNAKAYADGLVVNLWDDRGIYNASTTNTWPTTGGSGTAGAILKNDVWTIGTIATSGPLLNYLVGTVIRAIVDAPGSTNSNWVICGSAPNYGIANTSGKLSQFAATTSAELLGVISDETGSGALVFANTPTLVSPLLGTPTSGNLANCTFPTLNQSTTGSAATLTTSRSIHGGSFNGSADVTNIIAATYGGTGNAYTQFTGPTTSIKIFTLPDASSTLLYSGGALGTPSSGTLTNCTFPTLNQSTTGSAATLTTSRSIHGGSFNGSADVTNVIAATYGGTGNAYTTFTGPTTARSYALPDASVTLLYSGGALGTPSGGTLTNCTFPTLNQSTTGSAATLTTARSIYGNNFDGSVALAQVIAATYGGTGNAFTQFTGPTTSIKTFTLPDASSTLLYSGGALGTPSSGTLTNCTIPSLSGEVSNISNAITLSNSAVIAKVLTGFTSGSGTVTASDSILSAIQKVDGNTAANLVTAKAYADGLVVGLWDDRGSYNASTTNAYPAAGGSGTAGAVLKGDVWTVSVVAASGPLLGYAIGTIVRALTDAPGQTVGNWAVTEVGFGYTPANVAGNLSQFASTTSAQLLSIISDKTGSGSLVFATNATLVTPILGTPTSGILTNCTGTASGLTAGAATILATTRSIHGGSFNGSADVTNIIAATYGGTNNAFTQFTGPTTAIKTFTLPDASATLLYSGGALGTPSSGTLTNCTFPNLTVNTSGTAAGLSATLVIASGGTNATSFTAPSGNVNPIIYYDGTRLTNDTTITDFGYNSVTNTVVAANITVSGILNYTNVSVGYQTIATSGIITTLTVSSPHYTNFSGSANQTLKLPAANTLTVGFQYEIDNNSTGTISIVDGNSGALFTLPPTGEAYLTCTGNGSIAGTWNMDYVGTNFASGKSLTVNNTLTFAGTDGTTMTFPSTSATLLSTAAAVTVAQGGTGLATLTVNNVILGNGTANVQLVAPGASGNVLTSNGTTWASSAPVSGATITNDTTTNTNQYLGMSRINTGTWTSAYVASTALYYNPSSGILSSGGFNSLSDKTLKYNIVNIKDAISILNNINGVKFNWIKSNNPSVGLIAQEVEKVLPELVTLDLETHIRSLNYNGIIGVLVEAVKELSNRVQVLEGK